MRNPAQVAELTEFLRAYYAETAGHTPARIAYLRAEAWHYREYEARRFKNYEAFKVSKCRFLKKNRIRTPLHYPRNATPTGPQCPDFLLFQRVLDTHIATPELRESYREQWNSL